MSGHRLRKPELFYCCSVGEPFKLIETTSEERDHFDLASFKRGTDRPPRPASIGRDWGEKDS